MIIKEPMGHKLVQYDTTRPDVSFTIIMNMKVNQIRMK
jgi:hypothetical protein